MNGRREMNDKPQEGPAFEPREEDIDRNRRSFTALYEQGGSDVHALIGSLAESHAYTQALLRFYRIELFEIYKEARRIEREMK